MSYNRSCGVSDSAAYLLNEKWGLAMRDPVLLLIITCVFCEDSESSIKGIMIAAVLDFFSRNPGWNVAAMNRWLMIYRQGKYVKPNALDSFFNTATTISELLLSKKQHIGKS